MEPASRNPRQPARAIATRTLLQLCLCAIPALMAMAAHAAELTSIERVKPSVVGIGTFLKSRSPEVQHRATGFVVADGRFVITNAHAVDKPLDVAKQEALIVLVSQDGQAQQREAQLLGLDKDRDLALLRISGDPLPALKLGDSDGIREGRTLLFTGFPIAMGLGFQPATHRAMVAAITPVALHSVTAQQSNARIANGIRDSVYNVFQLNGTAFPGHAGSALYDPDDGTVYGIINNVFMQQGSRQSAIGRPSAMTYAIPSNYVRDLLQREKVAGFDPASLAPPAAPPHVTELTQNIERVKPSVIGIGTFLKSRSPAIQVTGTGFVVADGRHAATTASVVDKPLDAGKQEILIVLVLKDGQPQPREAQLLALDKDRDLALLRISGDPLPALKLGDSAGVREGRTLVFTGFRRGMSFGFRPETYRGMVAAITPVALPGVTARQLTARTISRIRDSAYSVFQLDGTAFPGNAGSALYDPDDGTVYGIINSVFVQGTRESAMSRPSGITYAIPSNHIRDLLQREKVVGSK